MNKIYTCVKILNFGRGKYAFIKISLWFKPVPEKAGTQKCK